MFSFIPLIYQLISAYRPVSPQPVLPSNTQLISAVPSPTVSALSPGSVLGITSAPKNIGGEGQVITMAILGDSMVDTLGQNLLSLQKSLSDYFPKIKFKLLNYGLGSSTIESGLSRLNQSFQNHGQLIEPLINQKPDIIVIESFAYNNFGNSPSGLDRHTQAFDQIVRQISEQLPLAKILIATTISPNSVNFAKGVSNLKLSSLDRIERSKTIQLYLQNTIKFAANRHLPLADTYHYSLENGSDGRNEYIDPIDNLHPSALGAKLFSDTIADSLHTYKLIE